jgi:hypothetical protein
VFLWGVREETMKRYDMMKEPVFIEMMESIERQRALFTGKSKKRFLERWLKHTGYKTLTEAKEAREKHWITGPLWEDIELGQLLNILEREGKSRDYIERMYNTVHTFYKHGVELPLSEALPREFQAKRASASTR